MLLLAGTFIGYAYGAAEGNGVLYAIVGGVIGVLLPSALSLAFKIVRAVVIAAVVIGGLAFLINLGDESTNSRNVTDTRIGTADLSKIQRPERSGAPAIENTSQGTNSAALLEPVVPPANGSSTNVASDSGAPTTAPVLPVTPPTSTTRSDMREFQSAMQEAAGIIFNMKCTMGRFVYSYDARPLTVARDDGGFDVSIGEQLNMGSTVGWRAGLEQLDLSTPEISGPLGDCMRVDVRCRIAGCTTGGSLSISHDSFTIYTKGVTQANELINALRRAQSALGPAIN